MRGEMSSSQGRPGHMMKRWTAWMTCAATLSLVLSACVPTTRDNAPAKQDQRQAAADGRCELRPPFTPNFEPELKWEWTGSLATPNHDQVITTPVVVDVNQDGIPDIVFTT